MMNVRKYLPPVALVVLTIALFCVAFAASVGPNEAATASDWTEYDPWTNVTRGTVDNNLYATYSFTAAGELTSTLAVTDYSFGVPAGATIDGVVAEIAVFANNNPYVTDYSIKLTKDGSTAVGTNQSTSSYLSTSESYVTYGSSSSLWGTTLSVSDVNSANFGVACQWTLATGTSKTVFVDHVRMTVYYTAAASGAKKRIIGFARQITPLFNQ